MTLVIHGMVGEPMKAFAWKMLETTSPWRALIQLLFLARRVRALSHVRHTSKALQQIIHTWHRPLTLILSNGNRQLLKIAALPLVVPGLQEVTGGFPQHPQHWDKTMATASGLPGLEAHPLLFKQRFTDNRYIVQQRIMQHKGLKKASTGILTTRLNLWLLVLQATGHLPMDPSDAASREHQVRGCKAILMTTLRSAPDLLIPHLRFISINMLRVHMEWILSLPSQAPDHAHERLRQIILQQWTRYARAIV